VVDGPERRHATCALGEIAMALQSLVSLDILGLVIAHAVNVFG
jgi:hypothetical protein